VLVRIALALAVLAVAAPSADAKLTCRSGHTEFTHGHSRIFSLRSEDGTEWRICSLRLRHPRMVGYPTGLIESMHGWRARGRRVAFEHDWIGGDEEGWAVGWVDITTGATKEALVANSDGLTDIPIADGGDAIALGSDGAIAFVAKEPDPAVDQIVGYVPFDGRRFGTPRVVAQVPAGDAVPSSLALDGDTVSWRTQAGAQMSARVNAVAAAASTMVTIIGARARIASAAAARPTARASIANPPSAVNVS
jgi:hypothetical protein